MYDLKVGIIGTGFQGKKLLAVYQRLGATVILCSADVEGGKALAEENGCKFYTDYKEMISREKLDCVHICLAGHGLMECGIKYCYLRNIW